MRATAALVSTGDPIRPGINFTSNREPEADWTEILGLTNFVTDPETARDLDVRLAVRVTDASGESCTDERDVVAR